MLLDVKIYNIAKSYGHETYDFYVTFGFGDIHESLTHADDEVSVLLLFRLLSPLFFLTFRSEVNFFV